MLTSSPPELLEALASALLDEERARAAVREARVRQASALRQLQADGMTWSVIAHRVSRTQGRVLPVHERLRLAERLRKRACARKLVPADLAAAPGATASAKLPSA